MDRGWKRWVCMMVAKGRDVVCSMMHWRTVMPPPE